MNYDPRNTNSRQQLAEALRNQMAASGFEKVSLPRTKEECYARQVNDKVRVVVYTTIVGDKARAVAKDAIRVVALYTAKDGRERGIAKADKRVNRTGKVEAIVERTLGRMREVFGAAKSPCACPDCGAPQFKSKKGNLVCADLCWTDKPKVSPKRSPSGFRYDTLTPVRPAPAPNSRSGFDISKVEAKMVW